MYLTGISISGVVLFQRSHPFFQRNWLICHTSCSHQFLERPLFYCKIAAVAIHSFKFTVFFFWTVVSARRYHSFQLNYQLWYLLDCRHLFIRRLVCFLMTSFTVIHFFYGTVIIPREYFKKSILSRALRLVYNTNCSHPLYQADWVCFKYIGRVLCFFWEKQLQLYFFKVSAFSTELVAINFASRVLGYAAILSWWMC